MVIISAVLRDRLARVYPCKLRRSLVLLRDLSFANTFFIYFCRHFGPWWPSCGVVVKHSDGRVLTEVPLLSLLKLPILVTPPLCDKAPPYTSPSTSPSRKETLATLAQMMIMMMMMMMMTFLPREFLRIGPIFPIHSFNLIVFFEHELRTEPVPFGSGLAQTSAGFQVPRFASGVPDESLVAQRGLARLAAPREHSPFKVAQVPGASMSL